MPATYVHLMIIGVACQEKKNKMSLRVRGGRGGFWQKRGGPYGKGTNLKENPIFEEGLFQANRCILRRLFESPWPYPNETHT